MRNGNRFVGPAIALATGVVALLAHRESPALVDPHACPGVLEWIGATAARYASSAPVGPWLLVADRILIVAAVASFVGAALTASRSWVAAIAAGLAFGAQPLLSDSFNVFDPAAAIVTAALATTQRPALVLALIAAGALIAPPATLPLAALAAWWIFRTATSRRSVWAIAAAGAVVGVVWILHILMPPIPLALVSEARRSCLLPVAGGEFLATLRDAALHWLAAPTMFALALAAFGAFARIRHVAAAPLLVAGFAVSMFMTASVDSLSIDRAMLPAAVLLWLIVAAGLAELLASARRGAPRVAVLALAALLPILQIPRLPAATEGAVGPAGHDAIAPAEMHHLIELLPDRASLVSEDAIVDLLLRAEHRSWARMGKQMAFVARDESAVTRAVRESPNVLAFPRAQLELQSLGFRLTDRAFGDVSGLAEVALVSPCAAIPRTWQALPTLNASRVLSIVAAGERDRGPLVLYLATDAPPQPVPRDWSQGVSQGYIASTFRLGPDADRLNEALKDDDLTSSDFASARYVVRFEIRRVPGAPRILSIDLAESPSVAYAKKWREAAEHRLLLCPSFPHTPAPIGIR